MDRAPNLQDFPSETRDTPKHERMGSDYKEIAREVLARIDRRLAAIDRDNPPYPSEDPSEARLIESRSETALGIMSSDDQAALVRLAWRGLIGLFLSASLVAAISFLWSHTETAMQTVAQVPQLVLDSMAPAEKPQPGPEPGPPATPKATAEAVPAQAAPLPRTAADYDRPKPAPVPPELTELMRKIDRNIAGLAQAVTELRLAQQQVAGDNAKSVEEIRASLDQLARAVARAPEQARALEQANASEQAKAPRQVAQAKPPAPPPASRAAVPRNRRFVPMYLSPI